jgi:hypothetical protein
MKNSSVTSPMPTKGQIRGINEKRARFNILPFELIGISLAAEATPIYSMDGCTTGCRKGEGHPFQQPVRVASALNGPITTECKEREGLLSDIP